MQSESKRISEERLEEFRRYLESTVRLEQLRLDESLRRSAETKIADIRQRMEESIQKAVEQYDRAMVQADGYANDPVLAIMVEPARESARKMMDTMIGFHQQIAEKAIRSIKDIMQKHQSRSKTLNL